MGHYINIPEKLTITRRSRKDLELAELKLWKLSDQLGKIYIILEDLFNEY